MERSTRNGGKGMERVGIYGMEGSEVYECMEWRGVRDMNMYLEWGVSEG